jgi:hypothetical protein
MLIKLLVFALVAYGAWRLLRQFFGPAPRDGVEGKRRGAGAAQVEDMAQCAVCGTYVATSARSCGRQDCPRRG